MCAVAQEATPTLATANAMRQMTKIMAMIRVRSMKPCQPGQPCQPSRLLMFSPEDDISLPVPVLCSVDHFTNPDRSLLHTLFCTCVCTHARHMTTGREWETGMLHAPKNNCPTCCVALFCAPCCACYLRNQVSERL